MLKVFVKCLKNKNLSISYTKNSEIKKLNLDYLKDLNSVRKDFFEKTQKKETLELKESKKKFNENKKKTIKKKEIIEEEIKNIETPIEKQTREKKLTREILRDTIELDDKTDKKYEEKLNFEQEQRKNFEKHLPFLKQIKYQNKEERDERKAEKRKKFQVTHIVQILHNFHLGEKQMPLDRFIHYYLSGHREIDNRKNR